MLEKAQDLFADFKFLFKETETEMQKDQITQK